MRLYVIYIIKKMKMLLLGALFGFSEEIMMVKGTKGRFLISTEAIVHTILLMPAIPGCGAVSLLEWAPITGSGPPDSGSIPCWLCILASSNSG